MHPLAQFIHGRLMHLLSANEKKKTVWESKVHYQTQTGSLRQPIKRSESESSFWLQHRADAYFKDELDAFPSDWYIASRPTLPCHLLIPVRMCQIHWNQPFSKCATISFCRAILIDCGVCYGEITHRTQESLWCGVKPSDACSFSARYQILTTMEGLC